VQPGKLERVRLVFDEGRDTGSKVTANVMSTDADKMGKPRYDHGKPADTFLRKRDKILPNLSKVTFDYFERLFKVVNASLQVPMPAKKQ
jgi:hypothetical protein